MTSYPDAVIEIRNSDSHYDIRLADINVKSGWFHEPTIHNYDKEIKPSYLEQVNNRIVAGFHGVYLMVASGWTLTGGFMSGLEAELNLMARNPADGSEFKVGRIWWSRRRFFDGEFNSWSEHPDWDITREWQPTPSQSSTDFFFRVRRK